MSDIIISSVKTRKELRQFARFGYELYKDNPFAVPDLLEDTLDTFNPKKNPAFRFCEAELFIARRNGKIVGRIAAIINRRANETWNTKHVRFGWIDFIDDIEVTRLLMQTVEEWGRQRGMTRIVGPLGFTDLDPEGMLTDGFDQLGTVFSIYNYPYYPQILEQLGFTKKVDWLELKVTVPDAIPEKYLKITDIVMKRNNLRIKKPTGKDLLENGYGQKMFELVNEAYAQLFGFSDISQKQIDQYVREFLPLVDLDLVTLIENADTGELIAFGACMPSLANAMRKSGGKLFPFGWFHLLKALKFKRFYEDTVNLMLIAVKPEYQSRGVNAPIFSDLIPHFQRCKFKYANVCPMLETNSKVLAQWEYFEYEIARRRRCFGKDIDN